MLPKSVVSQFEYQLEAVALSADEDLERRQRAGFQYGVMVLSRLQLNTEAQSRISKSLNMLQLSAELGDREAGGIVGWLRNALYVYLHRSQSQPVQTSWLEEGVLRGSSTARRHLNMLDPETCQKALEELRDKRAGVGYELPCSWFNSDEDFLSAIEDAADDDDSVLRLLQCLSTRGSIGLMRALTDLDIDINTKNEWGETGLFCACRSGQAAMVRFLLEKGADPSQQTKEGLTPLHFLSAFADTDIPDIASRLMRHNAHLEARATSEASIYHIFLDSPYGIIAGTPLTWAVVAGSLAATRALVHLGADAFDRTGRDLPVDHRWSSIVHTSPVVHAAAKHQWQLLEILLPATPYVLSLAQQLFRTGYGWNLNNSMRPVGPWGDIDYSTPLEHCVRYLDEGLLGRLLLHGEAHEVAFKKTFELLVNRGCDTFTSNGQEKNILSAAIEFGQPFVIRHLMEWRGGRLRPSPEEWAVLVLAAVRLTDMAMFQTLMEYKQIDQKSQDMWRKFFSNGAETDEVAFLEPFKTCLDPASDYTVYLEKAITLGNFSTARWFYSSARCDITRFDPDRRQTILGTLLMRSKHSANRSTVVKEFFDLPLDPEDVFDRVSELVNSSFTALHLASYFPEYTQDAVMATHVLGTVLDKYHEPRHLNCQVETGHFKGFTALHLAVSTCNIGAVCLLLEEEGLDTSLLTDKRHSAMDLALVNLGNQAPAMRFWDVPEEAREAEDMKHWMRAVEVQMLLLDKGIQPYMFLAVVVRTEPGDILYIPANKDGPRIQLPCE